MNKILKIQKVLEGEKGVGVPFSIWTHFPEYDLDPDKMAKETFSFYKQYDLDFIKTMNNGMYSVEDFGAKADYSEIASGGLATLTSSPIEEYEDWNNLPQISIDSPALSRELKYLENLIALTKDEVPVVMTIFSPLTTAKKLANGRLIEHLQNDEKGYVKKALEQIALVTQQLAFKAIELGAAGIYLASQMTSYDVINQSLYEKYGVPYDLIVLEGAKKGWFNSVHLHGNDIMFDLVKGYPVHVFNWHIWESLPEIEEAYDFTGKIIMGGLNRYDVTKGNMNQI